MVSSRRVLRLSAAVLLWLPVVLFLGSCHRPSVEDRFVRVCDAAEGVYGFQVDFPDTLTTVDVSLYTRFDAAPRRLSSLTGLPLQADWISPSGQRYSETVYLQPGQVSSGLGRRIRGSRFCRECIEPYRSGLLPYETGQWNLELRPLEDLPGFRGLGIIVRRHDGTR